MADAPAKTAAVAAAEVVVAAGSRQPRDGLHGAASTVSKSNAAAPASRVTYPHSRKQCAFNCDVQPMSAMSRQLDSTKRHQKAEGEQTLDIAQHPAHSVASAASTAPSAPPAAAFFDFASSLNPTSSTDSAATTTTIARESSSNSNKQASNCLQQHCDTSNFSDINDATPATSRATPHIGANTTTTTTTTVCETNSQRHCRRRRRKRRRTVLSWNSINRFDCYAQDAPKTATTQFVEKQFQRRGREPVASYALLARNSLACLAPTKIAAATNNRRLALYSATAMLSSILLLVLHVHGNTNLQSAAQQFAAIDSHYNISASQQMTGLSSQPAAATTTTIATANRVHEMRHNDYRDSSGGGGDNSSGSSVAVVAAVAGFNHSNQTNEESARTTMATSASPLGSIAAQTGSLSASKLAASASATRGNHLEPAAARAASAPMHSSLAAPEFRDMKINNNNSSLNKHHDDNSGSKSNDVVATTTAAAAVVASDNSGQIPKRQRAPLPAASKRKRAPDPSGGGGASSQQLPFAGFAVPYALAIDSKSIGEQELLPLSAFNVEQPSFSDLMRTWPPTTSHGREQARRAQPHLSEALATRFAAQLQQQQLLQQQRHEQQQQLLHSANKAHPRNHKLAASASRNSAAAAAAVDEDASAMQARNYLNEDLDDTIVTADQSFDKETPVEPPAWINYLGESGDYMYATLRALAQQQQQQHHTDAANATSRSNAKLGEQQIDELLDDFYYDQYENSQVLYYGAQLAREGELVEIGCYLPSDQPAEWTKSGRPLAPEGAATDSVNNNNADGADTTTESVLLNAPTPRVVRRSNFIKQNFSLKIYEAHVVSCV